MQGMVVSAAVAGAAVGSAAGGALSDACGRKRALLLGDVLFAAGALAMAAAQHVSLLIAGAQPCQGRGACMRVANACTGGCIGYHHEACTSSSFVLC